MKNRYLKGAHISERKVRELIKLFCEDLTATQIANITGISRITVNAYLKMIRTHIALYCEERNPIHLQNGSNGYFSLEKSVASLDQSYSNGTLFKKSFYGLFKHGSTIHANKMTGVDQTWLYNWLKGRVVATPEAIEKYKLSLYNGIMDFNSVKLFRVNTDLPHYTKGKSQIDEIDLFWGLLKSRLVKFRGLNGGTLYLHVKETEFRYNYRSEDIFEMLVNIIHKRPLHFVKQ